MAAEAPGERPETRDRSEPADDPRAPGDYGPSVIGSTLIMRGELTLDEDLTIDGVFHGRLIDGARRLSIGTFARVTADIRGESADIAGTIDGEFEGSGTVFVRRTARVQGAISAGDVRIEDGTNLENVVVSGRITRAEEK